MKYTTIKIHNQSVSNVFICDTEEDAKNVIRDIFFEQFQRVMNDEEIDDLEDRLEVYNDEDHDNQFTFSIFPVEG
jgi:hypothetical protein